MSRVGLDCFRAEATRSVLLSVFGAAPASAVGLFARDVTFSPAGFVAEAFPGAIRAEPPARSERAIFTEYIEGTSVDLRPIAGSHERFLE